MHRKKTLRKHYEFPLNFQFVHFICCCICVIIFKVRTKSMNSPETKSLVQLFYKMVFTIIGLLNK